MAQGPQRIEADVTRIVDELGRGLPAAPRGMDEQQFLQLRENIARAIVLAVQLHEQRLHAQPPEFGEAERPA